MSSSVPLSLAEHSVVTDPKVHGWDEVTELFEEETCNEIVERHLFCLHDEEFAHEEEQVEDATDVESPGLGPHGGDFTLKCLVLRFLCELVQRDV